MTKLIIVVFVGAFATALGSPLPTTVPKPTAAQQEVLDRLQNDTDFVNIGQIGNKIFIAYTPLDLIVGFANNGKHAMIRGKVCRDSGLEFASLKDTDEFVFIWINHKFDLWLSGVMRGESDSNRADAFVWLNGESLPENINFHMYAHELLCLYLDFPNEQLTRPESCLNGRHQTLCQLQLGEEY